MKLISFEDAVTATNLDPNQTHAVYYADGRFANRDAVARQCPHAKLYGITVTGLLTGPGVFAVDSETGDVPVDRTLAWVEKQIKLGVQPIAVYANLSRWLNEGLLAGVQALEKKYGVRVRKWLAHYTGNPVLEFPWVDAEQYADPGPVDRNVALADFFGDVTPTPPTKEDIVAIAVAELQGVPHVFVEDKNGDIFYTFQKQGQNAWEGGQAGKQIAGLTFFAPAPK
jgi:hypothetical protein